MSGLGYIRVVRGGARQLQRLGLQRRGLAERTGRGNVVRLQACRSGGRQQAGGRARGVGGGGRWAGEPDDPIGYNGAHRGVGGQPRGLGGRDGGGHRVYQVVREYAGGADGCRAQEGTLRGAHQRGGGSGQGITGGPVAQQHDHALGRAGGEEGNLGGWEEAEV